MSNKEEEIKKYIKKYKDQIELSMRLSRLLDNKDFRELIMEDYLGSYKLELNKLLVTPDEKVLQETINRLKGIAFLEEYMNNTQERGITAVKSLADSERLLRTLV